MKAFPRLIAAMVTPFKEDESIDFQAAQKLARHLTANGNEGLVISGTTGESPTLSRQEKLDLFLAVQEAVGKEVFLIANTGNNCTADSISLTQAAERMGLDAVMAVTPYYNKPSQEGLYRHYKTLAQSTALPVIIYNVPGRTGVNILPETVARLAEIENIQAIKEACGNLDQPAALTRILPRDFLVYSGDDGLTLPMLAVGCYGVVSVASHVAGRQMSLLIKSFLDGRNEEAAAINKKLLPLFKAMFITTNPVPVKCALAQMGLINGKLRLPLVEATPAEQVLIKKELEALQIQ